MQCSEDYRKCGHYVSNAYLYNKCVKDSNIGECMERKRIWSFFKKKIKMKLFLSCLNNNKKKRTYNENKKK